MRKLVRLLPFLLLILLTHCGPQATTTVPTTVAAPSATPVPPTATATNPPPSPTATQTATPSPTPTATADGTGWRAYPNALDFRMATPLEDGLWLASRSGLVKWDWDNGTWHVLTRADGLVNNTVTSLAGAGEWLWIGTEGGINAYNRASGAWRTYTTEQGLSSNHDISVYFDGETIWAGTRNGLSWYDPTTDGWQSIFSAAGVELAGVDCLLGDAESLWISVSPKTGTDGGLLQLDKESNMWTALSSGAGGLPFSSFSLAKNESYLWAIPDSGLPWEYNKRSGTWRPLSEIDIDGAMIGDRYLGAQYHGGALWLYANHSHELVRYSPDSHQVGHYPAEPLATLELQGAIIGLENTLLFTSRQGLLALYLDTGIWQPIRRTVGAVYRVLGERNGDLLVDSDVGPGFLNPEEQRWESLWPVGGSRQLVPVEAALGNDSKSVWLLTQIGPSEADGNGALQLVLFGQTGMEPQWFDLVAPAGWEIQHLLPAPVGNTLWFAGNHGFLSYNPAIDQWGVYEVGAEPRQIWQLAQREHQVWFVTSSELGHFDMNTGTFTLDPLPTADATEEQPPLLTISEDQIFLYAGLTLYQHEMESTAWRQIQTVAPCLEGANQLTWWQNALWLGGSTGIGQLTANSETWVCYGPTDGMLDTHFEQLTPTAQMLWFSHGERGLWRYQERPADGS